MELRTRQRRSAVVRHPVTGRRCWFNQIAFLNEWTLAPEVREYLVDVYGDDGLPFNTRFGNGDPIGEDVVQLLNEVYEANTAREPWQAGDLMLVDNIRTAHSREAYRGTARGAGRDGRPGASGRLLADRRGDRPMTTPFHRNGVRDVRAGDGATVRGDLRRPGPARAAGARDARSWSWSRPPTGCTAAGDSVNPPSYFLRFPDRPTARIIALPASIGGQVRVDGLKWISSFPDNVAAGIPRASAVLILNDHDTGYPFACLESSIISATRTAASAAAAADWLSRGRSRPTRVGFIGVGLIARYIHTFLAGTGWSFDEIGVHDLYADSAAGFRGYLEQSAPPARSPCTTAPSS